MEKNIGKNESRKDVIIFGFIIVLGCVIVFRNYIFGGDLFMYTDVNDDTFQSYVPAYQMVVNSLKQGTDSLMNLRLGYGANILGAQMVIFDPFAFILYGVGLIWGITAIPYALVYVHIFRIISAAYACRFFLKSFSLSKYAIWTGAFVYSFSAYTLGDMGQHYFFATALVFVPIMYGIIERINSRKKLVIVFSAIVAVCCIWSIYFSYMILVACGLYAFVRWLFNGNFSWKSAVEYFVPLLGAVICGIMLSAAIFIPTTINLLSVSDRINGSKQIDSIIFSFQQLCSYLYRFFSNQLQGTINSWRGTETPFKTAHLFCSAMCPVAFAYYLRFWLKKKQSRKKVVFCLSVALILIVCTTKIAGIVMNFFVAYEARYLYVLFPILAYIMGWWIDNIGTCGYKDILYTLDTGLISFFIILSGINWEDRWAIFSGINALFCIFLVLGLSIIYICVKRGLIHIQQIIFLIIGFCICFDGIISLSCNRNIVKKNWYDENVYDEAVHNAVDLVDADGDDFWRFERNFLAWGVQPARTYSEVENYRGISYYNSATNGNLINFRKEILGIENPNVNVGSFAFDPMEVAMDDVIADLSGIRYVVSDYSVQDPEWKLIKKLGEKYLYENESVQSAGIWYDSWCSEEQFFEMTELDKQVIPSQTVLLNDYNKNFVESYKKLNLRLSKALNYDSLLIESGNVEIIGNDCLKLQGDSGAGFIVDVCPPDVGSNGNQIWLEMKIDSKTSGDLKVMCDAGFGFSDVYWAQKSLSYQTDTSTIFTMKLPVDIKKLRFLFSNAQDEIICEPKIKLAEGRDYTSDGISLKNENLSGYIHGNIVTDRNRILVVPLLYENGWKAYLDDVEVPIIKADYTFMAFEIPSGEHILEVCYETPGLKVGMVVSLIGVVIFLLWIIKLKRN